MSTENELQGNKGIYILEQRPFASGGFSTLWLASDADDNIVCVKMFYPQAVPEQRQEHFLNELVSRQAVDHPNVLPLLDHGNEVSPHQGSSFIVLPYCTGGNLRDLMRGRDFLSPQLFFPILEQIAGAVDHAHANGIVHGDIKPENILFRDEDRQHAWLADFGIATIFPVSEDIATKADPVAGSTAYLSPEQIAENRQSSSSDIYALAMVTFEALTGQLPFDTTAPPFMQMAVKVSGDLLHPSAVNGRLSNTISEGLIAGLHVDPRKRPRTAVDFYRSLQHKSPDPVDPVPEVGEPTQELYSREDLLKLYRILSERFNLEELRSLCFEIGDVDYDDLPGSGAKDKARELVTFLARRNRLTDLLNIGRRTRPDIDWP